jgi:diguanylate cyclase (GGDEF)-like protein
LWGEADVGAGQTLLGHKAFASGLSAVLDYLGRVHPDLSWALTGAVPGGGHEVLEVRDPAGMVRPGDMLSVHPERGDASVYRLMGHAGEELGALWWWYRLPDPLSTQASPPLLELLAGLLTLILNADSARVASVRRSEVLHEQAHSDELTGLPNRRGWVEVLEVEQRRDDEPDAPSVIVIDLDRLKEVNDIQGHVAGDEYLQLAAVTLAAACRETDFVARLGGDEFGVLVGGSGREAAERLVVRIRQALDAAGVAASIGRAHYETDGGLIRTWWRADQEMYAEKQRRHRNLDLRARSEDGGGQSITLVGGGTR